jgi:hypothetical protein
MELNHRKNSHHARRLVAAGGGGHSTHGVCEYLLIENTVESALGNDLSVAS